MRENKRILVGLPATVSAIGRGLGAITPGKPQLAGAGRFLCDFLGDVLASPPIWSRLMTRKPPRTTRFSTMFFTSKIKYSSALMNQGILESPQHYLPTGS